jgi:phospholipid transport system substrate-binding protein
MTRRRTLSFFAFFVLWTAAPVLAQEGPAGRFLKTQHDTVVRQLRQRPDNPRIGAVVEGLLDFEEIAKRALTRHWDGLEASQRTEFVSLLTQLVRRNYQGNLERTLDYTIEYGGETASGDHVTVETTARSRENRRAPPVAIKYTMARTETAWVVHDIDTDGVCMVRNYRNQFNRIIERDGFPALLEKMRQRLAEGSEL